MNIDLMHFNELEYNSYMDIKTRGVRKRKLTNRDELSFLMVLALPKASITGLVWTTWSSKDTFLPPFAPVEPTKAK